MTYNDSILEIYDKEGDVLKEVYHLTPTRKHQTLYIKEFDENRTSGDSTLVNKDETPTPQDKIDNLPKDTQTEEPMHNKTTMNADKIKFAVLEKMNVINHDGEFNNDNDDSSVDNNNSNILNKGETDTKSITTGELEFDEIIKDDVERSI